MSRGNSEPPESEYVTCDNCGMGWTTRVLCEGCWATGDPECEKCDGTGDGGLRRDVHECPEPYPYEIALSMAQMAESMALRGSPMVVHPREKARIKLGLEQGPR